MQRQRQRARLVGHAWFDLGLTGAGTGLTGIDHGEGSWKSPLILLGNL